MKENIWIIGASSGIGAALALEYQKLGANLALSARNSDALSKLTNQAIILPMDVANYDQVLKSKQLLLQKWQKIDKIIFMAAIYQPMQFGAMDLDIANDIIRVNLLGPLNVIEATLPDLVKYKSQFAICASVAGYFGLPKSQPYSATKAALINLVESLKAEYGTKLDVRLINPGFVRTRLTDKNEFSMPLIISSDEAAKRIVKGLNSDRFEIHFPMLFTYGMKLLRSTPYFVFNKINQILM